MVYPVKSILQAGAGNSLTLAFAPTTSDYTSDLTGNRFMGCSGG